MPSLEWNLRDTILAIQSLTFREFGDAFAHTQRLQPSDTIAGFPGVRRCIRPHTEISTTLAIQSLTFGEFGDAFARTHTHTHRSHQP